MKVRTKDIINKGRYSFLDLENFLLENDFSKMSGIDFMNMLVNDFDMADVIYLIDAYRMPRSEITSVIESYDNSRPKANELLLVDNLASQYGVDRNTVVRRIQEVRIVNRKEKAINKGKKLKKEQK